ncbi:MAG: polysaccharide deacetylase [Chloroflexi bacterium]|nr:polysaccharide deacetylase [Chloroflexota bacterium]
MTGIWPGRTRCVVMLTFDEDGVSGWLRRDPQLANHPSLISMGEFGPTVGTPRILELLGRYGIRASFFIPGYVAENHPDMVREVVRQGHEVGHHGYMHEAPSSLGPGEDEGAILDKGTRILQELTGQRPLGYRSPSWELSERSLDLLTERGFIYDSSLMGNDIPYFVPTSRGRLVELPVHWSLDDAPYYTYAAVLGRTAPMASPQDVYNAWEWEFEGAYKYGRAFVLTMHPHTSGRLARLVALERLIQHMKSHPGVEFMRCVDVAQGWTDKGLRRRRVASSRR